MPPSTWYCTRRQQPTAHHIFRASRDGCAAGDQSSLVVGGKLTSCLRGANFVGYENSSRIFLRCLLFQCMSLALYEMRYIFYFHEIRYIFYCSSPHPPSARGTYSTPWEIDPWAGTAHLAQPNVSGFSNSTNVPSSSRIHTCSSHLPIQST